MSTAPPHDFHRTRADPARTIFALLNQTSVTKEKASAVQQGSARQFTGGRLLRCWKFRRSLSRGVQIEAVCRPGFVTRSQNWVFHSGTQPPRTHLDRSNQHRVGWLQPTGRHSLRGHLTCSARAKVPGVNQGGYRCA